MSLDLTALIASTAATTDAEAAAETLLLDLKTRLDNAIADLANAGVTPADLQQLTDISTALGANAATLSAAVVANTPAA